MYLNLEKVQNYFDYPSEHWLVLKKQLVWMMRPSATLQEGNTNILKCFWF